MTFFCLSKLKSSCPLRGYSNYGNSSLQDRSSKVIAVPIQQSGLAAPWHEAKLGLLFERLSSLWKSFHSQHQKSQLPFPNDFDKTAIPCWSAFWTYKIW